MKNKGIILLPHWCEAVVVPKNVDIKIKEESDGD